MTGKQKEPSANKQSWVKWIYESNGTFTKNLTDAFNCLVLKSNIKFNQDQVGDNVKHIEIADSKVSVLPYSTDFWADPLDLDLTSVLVDENCTFVVPVGTVIQTEATIKHGDIEVYGTYVAGEETGDGTIYYFNKQVNVATEKALKEALVSNTTEIIVLESDIPVETTITVEKEKTINLNGYTISAGEAFDEGQDQAAGIVANANLTIEGNGIVDGGSGNKYNMAIRANKGTITIKGGTYKVGADKEGKPNTVVYAAGEAKVIIEGGYFEYTGGEGKEKSVAKFLLNVKDNDYDNNDANIIVKGGTFKNFNPCANQAEGEGTSFVPSTHEVVVVGDGNVTALDYLKSNAYSQGKAVEYKVQVKTK